MPFPTQTPRTFTRENIKNIKGNPSGCYGLMRPAQTRHRPAVWIYVGKGDIKERLIDHLGGDNACITQHAPTHWLDVVADDYNELEKQLIREYDPICNRRIG